MIKNFKEFQNLYESIGSIDPSKFLTPQQIEWCNKHIEGEWSVNNKGEVAVSGDIKFKDKTFTKFEVQFANTKKMLDCDNCTNLTSLHGAPYKVNNFYCEGCTSLTTLQGAPQEVLIFNCKRCASLTTLEGGPQKAALFNCSGCTSLTTLQGAPQEVDYFYYNSCPKLDPEELSLKDDYPDLFKKWLASGMAFKEWKEKKKGMITGARYGLL